MADSPAPEADQSSDVEVAAPQPNLAVPSSPLRLNPPRQEPSNHPQKPCLWLRTRNNELIDLLSDDDERSRANRRPPQTVVSGSTPPTLPPSVEQAYKIKCIALKKRLNEVNASNDAVRERIVRQTRAVRKLRLERAILLNRLADIINKNGADVESLGIVYDDDSEGSSEGPPT
ncbi:MAG: hypothetical protein L6R39_003545, partial [Caloplaca ligustica]